MDKTNIKVEFTVISEDFDIDLLTIKLGIEPTQSYYKGDIIPRINRTREESIWRIETEYNESLDINDEVLKLMEKLYGKEEILKDLKNKHNLEYVICVVINVKNNQEPAIYLTEEVINLFSLIGIYFEIDLYI